MRATDANHLDAAVRNARLDDHLDDGREEEEGQLDDVEEGDGGERHLRGEGPPVVQRRDHRVSSHENLG